MATVVLIQAQPRLASTGAAVDIRLAGGGTKHYDQLGFTDWRAGVANVPRFSTLIGYGKDGPTGGAIPQTAGARFFSHDIALNSALANLIWEGARIVVSTGDDEAIVPTYRQRLLGTVAAMQSDGGAITLTLGDLSLDLDKPVCPNTFAGTGDLEGIDEANGRIKRRTWGRVFNVEGRLLDKAYNIYEFGDPAFPLSTFDMVKDKGMSGPIIGVAWAGSAVATLNALRAATVPSGGAAVAISIACVKWYTKPAGPLTADITGPFLPGDRTPAALAQMIAAEASPTMAIEPRANAVSWADYDSGIHCDTSSETVANLLDRLLLPVFIAWVLDGAGVFRFRRLTWSPPVGQLRAETISREEVFPAIKGRRLGFQKNHRQQTDSEINVTLLAASDGTYADGTPIEALKPAEAGANVTESRTANAILGQGDLATLDKLDRTGGFLTGFGDLSGLANLYFGSPYLLEQPGGAAATLAAFKTAAGYAAGFQGQGLLATLSSLALGSGYLTGFGSFAGISQITQDAQLAISRLAASPQHGAAYLAATAIAFSAGNTVEQLRPGEAGANVTENRNALGFQGQGLLATKDSLAYGGSFLTGFGGLAALAFVQFGASRTVVTSDGTTVTDQVVVTSAGYAAGFQGQGQLSTKDQAGYFELNLADLRSNTNDSMRRSYSQSLYTGTSYVPRGETPNNADPSNVPPGYTPLGYDQVIKAGGTIYVTVNGVHQTFGSATQNTFVAFVLLDTANNILATIRMPTGTLTNYLFIIPNTFGTRTIRWRVRVMSDGNNWSAVTGVGGDTYVADVAWKAL